MLQTTSLQQVKIWSYARADLVLRWALKVNVILHIITSLSAFADIFQRADGVQPESWARSIAAKTFLFLCFRSRLPQDTFVSLFRCSDLWVIVCLRLNSPSVPSCCLRPSQCPVHDLTQWSHDCLQSPHLFEELVHEVVPVHLHHLLIVVAVLCLQTGNMMSSVWWWCFSDEDWRWGPQTDTQRETAP